MPDQQDPDQKKRVLFLFSDTGGGHRAPTEAMIEALELEFPGRFESAKVDFFRQYYPRPLRYAPELYPPISRVPAPAPAAPCSWRGSRSSTQRCRSATPAEPAGPSALPSHRQRDDPAVRVRRTEESP